MKSAAMTPEELAAGNTFGRLTQSQQQLTVIAGHWHGDQKRKYTDEPYVHHLLAVAQTILDLETRFVGQVEIAICHDLIEDTKFDPCWLYATMRALGYSDADAVFIENGIMALTDHYTHGSYPGMNRRERKEMEAFRLHNIRPEYQTVKYADLLDNTSSITDRDPGFAKIYMVEKRRVLHGMRDGNPLLLEKCDAVLKLFFAEESV
jgi:(p)ppGpp synthase/HD superfamily hydrolase